MSDDTKRDDPTIVAWTYELAHARDPETGEYSDWRPYLTFNKPTVPPGSIRRLIPLGRHPLAETFKEEDLVYNDAERWDLLGHG